MPDEKTRLHPSFKGHHLADLHRWHNRYPRYEADSFPAKTGNLTVRWLEENHKAGPFFLWVDFFDPHEPWDPPEYLVKRYDPDYDGTPMIHPNYGRAGDYTPEELKKALLSDTALNDAQRQKLIKGRVLRNRSLKRQVLENAAIILADEAELVAGDKVIVSPLAAPKDGMKVSEEPAQQKETTRKRPQE